MADSFRIVGRLLRGGLRAVVPEAALAPLLPYRKISRERWNQEYAEGRWRGLEDVRDLARYSVIIGYCDHYRPGGGLLDVGCGEGILQRRLSQGGYGRYLGLDCSEEAISGARTRRDAHTEFCCADAENYEPQESFDIIIFNEVIYYFANPVAVVLRLARNLNPGGIIIVSMFRRGTSHAIWGALDRVLRLEDAVTVTNKDRASWDIKVFHLSA